MRFFSLRCSGPDFWFVASLSGFDSLPPVSMVEILSVVNHYVTPDYALWLLFVAHSSATFSFPISCVVWTSGGYEDTVFHSQYWLKNLAAE